MGDTAAKLPEEIAREQFAAENNVDLELLEKEERARADAESDTKKMENPLGEDDDEDGEDDEAMPSAGVLPYLAIGCIPCIGMVAVNKEKEAKALHAKGEAALALHTTKSAAHIGFLGVVFGTMIWMVVFGLIIKPLIASDPPCEGYPDCVPDAWLERTLAGSPPE